ncbi:MAG TPA: hypothetical protein PKA10_02480 [Selenomonadales bacterium]|nr:hypothetical protein [Selenomonadales bacterium]
MKIAMITGSYPPETCGVGDYTYCLVSALRDIGVNVEVVNPSSWRISNFQNIVNQIKLVSPDLIHVQYPTRGYGYHLTPQFLSVILPVVSTIHEVSQTHILRRLSLLPFFMNSTATVFTNEYEREYVKKYFPWRQNRSTIIPIGSNVPKADATSKDIDDIIYFGLIRPNKGLEQVIDLAKLIVSKNFKYTVRIIGAVDERHSKYFAQLRNNSEGLPVQWNINVPIEEIAAILSRSRIGYLPFPDGASERRGSLLALLTNRVTVITKKGPYMPRAMEEAVLTADTVEQALVIINKLLSESTTLRMCSEKANTYAQRYSWSMIANQHVALYERILANQR